MRILGIDPALTRTGYGVIDYKNNCISLVEAGVVSTSSKNDTPKRLAKIYNAITRLILDTSPDVMIIEKIYSHYRHPITSYLLGQARGIICLTSALQNIEVMEYAATRIKKAIVGNGLATKLQVQKMVMKTLNLHEVPKYNDVSDALALAIAHCYIARTVK